MSVFPRCCIRICSAMVGVPHRPLMPSLLTAFSWHLPSLGTKVREPAAIDWLSAELSVGASTTVQRVFKTFKYKQLSRERGWRAVYQRCVWGGDVPFVSDSPPGHKWCRPDTEGGNYLCYFFYVFGISVRQQTGRLIGQALSVGVVEQQVRIKREAGGSQPSERGGCAGAASPCCALSQPSVGAIDWSSAELRTATSQTYEAVPKRARIQGS